MIFSSLEFLLLFLPITVVGYYFFLGHAGKSRSCTLGWLLFASLFYYAYWKPENIFIILGSLFVNYFLAGAISSAEKWRKPLFILGLVLNLGALGYYKYTDFFLGSLNALGADLPLQGIVLPIGISFFTFQQIAYLSDIYTKRHDPTGQGFLHYGLFVCFFPQLVAGPIVHHREMMPQFAAVGREIRWDCIYRGLIVLSIGLAKKVLIADNLSPIVRYAFDSAPSLNAAEAVFSSVCYTLQLYFDFSGYCDMAVGCALFFGIELPWNFNSPYKAADIQDFWRRWHITLSRWLRDYLYIPLGGSRSGAGRTLCNLFLTFLLGGLWHGAAWTFVLWGAMHGAALALHRMWKSTGRSLPRLAAWPLTLLFVNTAWILFRAQDFACVEKFAKGLLFGGWTLSSSFVTAVLDAGLFPGKSAMRVFVVLACLIALFGWNSQKLMEKSSSRKVHFWAVFLLVISLAFLCIPEKPQEFIYFQF